jgi:hypothetical protein
MFGALEEGRLLRFGIVLAAAGILALFCLAGDAYDPLKHLLYALLILALAVVQPVISGEIMQARGPLSGPIREPHCQAALQYVAPECTSAGAPRQIGASASPGQG